MKKTIAIIAVALVTASGALFAAKTSKVSECCTTGAACCAPGAPCCE